MKTEKYLNDNTIRIEVDYQKGGRNWFSGAIEPRGYVLRIQPCSVEKCGDSEVVQTYPMEGRKTLLTEVGRRNDKKQAALWTQIEPHVQHIADLFTLGNFGMIPPYIKEKILLTA